MKPNRNDIDLMLPAGSYESLNAAINAGANSVYFGVGKLNMRSKSSVNFTIEDLKNIANICNEKGIKTYLTVNTVIYDEEIEEMHSIIDAAKEAKITAIIASDMAVIDYCVKVGIEIHISTQLNVSNYEAVKYYSKYADVIVLARELSLEQQAAICKRIEDEKLTGPSGKLVKIEVFAHGALCMAISGKCYLSLHDKNRSGNRGACIQNCRRPYIVTEKESGYELEIDEKYIMSPKDLCTIDFLDKLLEAGVKVLKIEGRGRPPEYVKRVTECYSEAIESYFEGTFSEDKVKVWKEKLSTVFNRGFWGGYYMGKTIGEWSERYGSAATKRKVYIGKGMNYFKNIKVGSFLVEAYDIKKGDEILITGPSTGAIETKIEEMRVDEKIVDIASKGEEFSMKLDFRIRPSDKLFKVVDAKDVAKQ